MTPREQKLALCAQVARIHGITPEAIMAKGGNEAVELARFDFFAALQLKGWNYSRIAAGTDRTPESVRDVLIRPARRERISAMKLGLAMAGLSVGADTRVLAA